MPIHTLGIKQVSIYALCIVSLSACSSADNQSDAADTNMARPAKLIELSSTHSIDYLSYPAVVQSNARSVLSFEVSGVLSDVRVVAAQRVEKGDVLATLDQENLAADLDVAKAEFKNAESEYQRALRLLKQDAISRSEMNKRKSTRDVRKAGLDSAQKNLNDTVLVAPFSGSIARVSVEKRAAIQAGEEAITILGEGNLEAKINIPASVISKAGRAENTEDVNSYFTLESDRATRIPAVFKEVILEADSASQTYEVTFGFEAPQEIIILPGMNGTVWFQDPSSSNASLGSISVPLTAISADGAQKFVWIVDPETQSVSRRSIEVEEGVGDSLRIVSGLEQGDTIVEAGISALSEGMKVSRWVK